MESCKSTHRPSFCLLVSLVIFATVSSISSAPVTSDTQAMVSHFKNMKLYNFFKNEKKLIDDIIMLLFLHYSHITFSIIYFFIYQFFISKKKNLKLKQDCSTICHGYKRVSTVIDRNKNTLMFSNNNITNFFKTFTRFCLSESFNVNHFLLILFSPK